MKISSILSMHSIVCFLFSFSSLILFYNKLSIRIVFAKEIEKTFLSYFSLKSML